MRRRDFLKSGTSVVAISTLPLGVLTPQRAQAEVVTCVIAVIAFVSAVASFFSRPNGDRQLIAALNAKLDLVLRNQQRILEGIAALGTKVDNLASAIPNYLENESLRLTYAEARGTITRLNGVLLAIQTEGPQPRHESMLDSLVDEVWVNVGRAEGNLATVQTGDDQDFGILDYGTRIVQTYRDALAALKAADVALGLKDERQELHVGRYSNIAKTLTKTLTMFRTRHLTVSLKYHESRAAQIDKQIVQGEGQYFAQWQKHIHSFAPDSSRDAEYPVNKSTKFHTFQSFGPCTHGHNSNDIQWANDRSFVRILSSKIQVPWTVFEQTVPARTSGTMTYHDGKPVGYSELAIRIGDPSRRAVHSGSPKRYADPAFRNPNNAYAVKMPTAFFNCPGVADGDREAYSLNYTVRGRNWAREVAPRFTHLITKKTEHEWYAIAARLIDQEMAALQEDAEKTQSVI